MNDIPFDVWLQQVENEKKISLYDVTKLSEEQIKFFHVCRDAEDSFQVKTISYPRMAELFNERFGTSLNEDQMFHLWEKIKKSGL